MFYEKYVTNLQIMQELCQGDRLLPLTRRLREADFGRTYVELKSAYPNWSRDLHGMGNYLSDDKLQLIFDEGLLLWYIKYETVYPNSYVPNSVDSITFYEFKSLIKIALRYKISVPEELIEIYSYDNYQMVYFRKYLINAKSIASVKVNECISFKGMIAFEGYHSTIESILEQVKFRTNNILTHFSGNFVTGIRDLIIKHTAVSKLGLVFQRWKVVLEKMSEHVSQMGEEYGKKMYKIDLLLERLQELIYNQVKIAVVSGECVIETGDMGSLLDVLTDESIYTDVYGDIYGSCFV